MNAALAHREGSHADVLLQHVAIAEQEALPMQLLQENMGGGTDRHSLYTHSHTLAHSIQNSSDGNWNTHMKYNQYIVV